MCLCVALVAVISQNTASRCRRQQVCLRSLRAPRMIMYFDTVSSAALLELMLSVV
jgi:hypothetical protein